MSAEPTRVTKTEAWKALEGQVVNDVFPLRSFLGGSDHSAVFLSEYKAGNLADAAIKFVPTGTPRAEARFEQWRTAALISHPHLIRLFDVGRCQLHGRGFLFVVMEYAEQTLAQLLPRRALSPDEAREMLPPMLDALSFLHRNQLVQGQLKPSNVLVVNDQVKLASDTVRPAGDSAGSIVTASSYDPPELRNGRVSSAGDLWALGVTLVEALTQRTPAWPDERYETVSLPVSLPAPFADTVQRCLSRTPDNRPTAAELEAQYKPPAQAPVMPVEQPSAGEAPRETNTPEGRSRTHVWLFVIAGAFLIFLAARFALLSNEKQTSTPPLPSSASQTPPLESSDEPAAPERAAPLAVTNAAAPGSPPSGPDSRPIDQASLPSAADADSVLHEVIPEIPQHILDGIRGHVRVTVRVLVEPAGDVVGGLLEEPGPSRYFARHARDSADEWQFVPADEGGFRVWLLRFDFSRDGVTAEANAVQ